MKEKVIRTRVDLDTNEQLEALAKRLDVSISAAIRMFIRDGLAQYDRRHDMLAGQLEQMAKSVERAHVMAAAALAATVLPAETGRRLHGDARDLFQKRADSAVYFGMAIKDAHDRGAFGEEDSNVPAA